MIYSLSSFSSPERVIVLLVALISPALLAVIIGSLKSKLSLLEPSLGSIKGVPSATQSPVLTVAL